MTGKSLKDADKRKVQVTKIEYQGDALILPQGMGFDDAIELIQRRKKFLTEEVAMQRAFDVFPWDGAVALDTVLNRMYGWAPAIKTPGFFTDHPPKLVDVEVARGVTKQVPWGRFLLPQIKGWIQTAHTRNNKGQIVFQLHASVIRADEADIQRLFDEVEKECKANSIYRGKAVRIRFKDDNGEALGLPQVSFIDTDIDENSLVYSKDIEDAIDTNLFSPIERHDDLAINGLAFKRGVLLGGVYGTGKTLAAKVASKKAVAAGLTYIYVPRADELAEACEFAKQYQSPASIVFCEDIDRALKGERSVKIDDILNIIDGIDSKNQNVMIVLTTNHLESITKAMLRPGRLDAVIEVMPPDSEAVQRLLHVYGKGAIDKDADLSAVGQQLDGQIPAVIAEVVKRAKLAQVRLQPKGVPVTTLTPEALLVSAKTMTAQLGLLNEKPAAKPVDQFHHAVRDAMAPEIAHIEKVERITRKIGETMGLN